MLVFQMQSEMTMRLYMKLFKSGVMDLVTVRHREMRSRRYFRSSKFERPPVMQVGARVVCNDPRGAFQGSPNPNAI
jgi:hypothetical protein